MKENSKAVVIGGSMAGLMAARALSDVFDEVIVLDRDDLAKEGECRRGVPQGQHAHALLAGGSVAMEEMFPGLMAELISNGAIPCDAMKDGRWFFEGRDLLRADSGIRGAFMSRPLLEDVVRRRVREISCVEIRDKQAVRGLVAHGDRITGVRTEFETIEADLVVDAAGRGSQTPHWLESLGFEAPREEEVGVQLTYTTRIFRREPHHLNGDVFALIPPTPDGKRGGVVGAMENNEWIVTLFGHFGQKAPGDLEGYIEYARSLPADHIFRLLSVAEPIGEPRQMNYPASVRRRYEALTQRPEGFLAFGDAICSFNPIYGQGMSSAALQCRALMKALNAGTANLSRRFYKDAAKVVDNPWSIAVGTDLKMKETAGKRGLNVKLINWYVGLLHKRGHDHLDAASAFIRVAQLLDAPPALMRPPLAARILWSSFYRWLRLRGREQKPARLKTPEPSRQVHTSGF